MHAGSLFPSKYKVTGIEDEEASAMHGLMKLWTSCRSDILSSNGKSVIMQDQF
jgi:hypothetical protein